MHLLVLGATGPLGLQIVKRGLEKSHKIRVLVRNAEKMKSFGIESSDLDIVEGDMFDEAVLTKHIRETDSLLCAIGGRPTFSRVDLLTNLVPLIVKSIKSVNTAPQDGDSASQRRLVLCTAAYAENKTDHPFFIEWIFKPLVIGRLMQDFVRAERFLVEENEKAELDFVVVKPGGLTNEEPRDHSLLLAQEGQRVEGGTSRSIPRANVALFMLDNVVGDKWHNKLVTIAF